jgi:serine/threonine protein kinase
VLLDENYHIKITDFGSAKILNAEELQDVLTGVKKRGSFVGTAEYCSRNKLFNHS